jgi:hypothetical protein
VFRVGALAAILCVFVTTLAAAQNVSGQRTFSVLTVNYTINGSIAQVTVSLSLAGVAVDQVVLTYGDPTYHFLVQAAGYQAAGDLALVVAQAPTLSRLQGQFTVRTGTAIGVPFEGEITTWTAPDQLILLQRDYNLSSELRARTIVRNGSRYGADVQFMAADALLFEALLLPPSPVAVTPKDLVIGSLKLNQGARLTLLPPSSLSDGIVSLDCSFSSASILQTDFNAAIASWPLQTPGISKPAENNNGVQRNGGDVRTNLHIQSLPGRRQHSRRVVRLHARPERQQPEPAHHAG